MGPHWTAKEKSWLRENYLMHDDEVLGKRLGRSRLGVRRMRHDMGLLRPRQWMPAVKASLKVRRRNVSLIKRYDGAGYEVEWWDGNRRRRMMYGRAWWLLNVGPLEEDDVVVHKDGDRYNIDPSNFAVVKRSEISMAAIRKAQESFSKAGRHWRRMEKHSHKAKRNREQGVFNTHEQEWL